jgi:hypothetical protein
MILIAIQITDVIIILLALLVLGAFVSLMIKAYKTEKSKQQ